MVDVGDDNLSVISESSDLQRARKMYADLQAMSMESAAGSLEVNMQTLLVKRQLQTLVMLFRMSTRILTPTRESSTTRSARCRCAPAAASRTS